MVLGIYIIVDVGFTLIDVVSDIFGIAVIGILIGIVVSIVAGIVVRIIFDIVIGIIVGIIVGIKCYLLLF